MELNVRVMIKILSYVTIIFGIAMVPSILISIFFKEYDTAFSFIKVMVPALVLGISISFQTKVTSVKMKMREGFLVVVLSWLLVSLLGCIPYLLTNTIESPVDAFFESISSFTTTGASIISDVEVLSKGILFWRSFCQWLGGMGILIFTIGLLPALGIGGQLMAGAETPGPTLNKIVPKMSNSAKILYKIYLAFTSAAVILLMLGGLNLFDALIAAFGSVASGGLSNYNDGISHFNSSYVEFIVAFFTILACINFTLYYPIPQGKLRIFFSDHELRAFLLILCVSATIITWNIWTSGIYTSLNESLRLGFFQATAFLTTTGHYSANFNAWPSFSKMMLFLLMLIGGCSSSTGSGIKVIRIVVLFNLVRRNLIMKLHPNAIIPIKINDRTITSNTMIGILSFLYLYVLIFMIGALILSFENLDLTSTFTTVAATLNNVGTGLELIGPSGNFALFSDFSKVYLCFLMLMGRLELFTIVLLFIPSFWNEDH